MAGETKGRWRAARAGARRPRRLGGDAAGRGARRHRSHRVRGSARPRRPASHPAARAKGGVRVSPEARWRGRGWGGWGSGAGGLARAWRGRPLAWEATPTPESAVRGRCGSRDRAPQRDLQALRRGLGNAAFCAVIFLFCNWQCEASPKVISGLCSWKRKAAPSSLKMEKPRNPLGGDHTNVAAPGSGEQGGPGRRSERQQLHFCPEAGVSYREDGGWSEK